MRFADPGHRLLRHGGRAGRIRRDGNRARYRVLVAADLAEGACAADRCRGDPLHDLSLVRRPYVPAARSTLSALRRSGPAGDARHDGDLGQSAQGCRSARPSVRGLADDRDPRARGRGRPAVRVHLRSPGLLPRHRPQLSFAGHIERSTPQRQSDRGARRAPAVGLFPELRADLPGCMAPWRGECGGAAARAEIRLAATCARRVARHRRALLCCDPLADRRTARATALPVGPSARCRAGAVRGRCCRRHRDPGQSRSRRHRRRRDEPPRLTLSVFFPGAGHDHGPASRDVLHPLRSGGGVVVSGQSRRRVRSARNGNDPRARVRCGRRRHRPDLAGARGIAVRRGAPAAVSRRWAKVSARVRRRRGGRDRRRSCTRCSWASRSSICSCGPA